MDFKNSNLFVICAAARPVSKELLQNEPQELPHEIMRCPSCGKYLEQFYTAEYFRCAWNECPASKLDWTHKHMWDFIIYIAESNRRGAKEC